MKVFFSYTRCYLFNWTSTICLSPHDTCNDINKPPEVACQHRPFVTCDMTLMMRAKCMFWCLNKTKPPLLYRATKLVIVLGCYPFVGLLLTGWTVLLVAGRFCSKASNCDTRCSSAVILVAHKRSRKKMASTCDPFWSITSTKLTTRMSRSTLDVLLFVILFYFACFSTFDFLRL